MALDVTFIDTADSYGPEVSEKLIAEALYPYPENLVIATKGGLTRPGQWVPDGRPEHLRRACEGSLARLRLDRIDLYQFHRPNPKVPIAEPIGALAKLKDEGKIRHIGVSNATGRRGRYPPSCTTPRDPTAFATWCRMPSTLSCRVSSIASTSMLRSAESCSRTGPS